MIAFAVLAGTPGIAGMYAFRRKKVHRSRMSKLDYNTHVNCAHGTSTITRLQGSFLREVGVSTVPKTTGTYGCIIHPQAGDHPCQQK